MRQIRFPIRPRRAVLLLLTLLLLLQPLTACRGRISEIPDGPQDTAADSSAGDGLLTLSPETTPEEPDPLPPPVRLQEGIPYRSLVITSYYAAGKVAGKAMAAASFAELYNGSDTPIPLAGVSLYVSDRGGDFTEYRFSEGDMIHAKGFFLIRGKDANGAHENVLSVERYDTCFGSLSPDPDSTRILLGKAGMTIPTDVPLAELEQVFDYVTAHPLDADDT